jgi:hypothetical protein
MRVLIRRVGEDWQGGLSIAKPTADANTTLRNEWWASLRSTHPTKKRGRVSYAALAGGKVSTANIASASRESRSLRATSGSRSSRATRASALR